MGPAILLGLMIAGCATGSPSVVAAERTRDAQAIMDKTWEWESTVTPVEKITVSQPERYTIRLVEGGRVEARFDCNRGGGSVETSEGKIKFGPMMATRMACPEDSQDFVFMRDLDKVTSFFVNDGNLYLEMPYDSGTMKFRLAP